ncbi:hypothetical protein Pmani_009364 [Petrolisthes manimaculis]|uniref:Uncharacterized protein n=1 Tax=Petrolisthes manimaculis TaxID=1843537 RepID=A0AAE1Q734_9EUCA|nr:hypothetical protein Pmani_009364 [Petrolisthes manimaculis]
MFKDIREHSSPWPYNFVREITIIHDILVYSICEAVPSQGTQDSNSAESSTGNDLIEMSSKRKGDLRDSSQVK